MSEFIDMDSSLDMDDEEIKRMENLKEFDTRNMEKTLDFEERGEIE